MLIISKINALLFLLFSSLFCLSVHADEYSYDGWLTWKQEYDQSLAARDGWLALAGLYWLEPGVNTLGSAKKNHHRFPANAPRKVGQIIVDENTIQFESALTDLTIDGETRRHSILSTEPPTRVAFGQFEFFVIERENKFALRLIDTQSPRSQSFSGTRFMPYQPQAIIQAKLIPHDKPTQMSVATVYGTTRQETSAGWLEFKLAGKLQRIEAVDYGEDSPLYLFFSDATSGETTYDAGRYLKVDWPDKNGDTVIDFNRAYNPPCAYTEYATCPLTPPQNRLEIGINAGELDYLKN